MTIIKYFKQLNVKEGIGIMKLVLLAQFVFLGTACAQNIAGNAPPEVTATEDTISRFWNIPLLEPAYLSTAPTDRRDGIPVGQLDKGGIDKATILNFAQEIADSLHGGWDSFLVAHQGVLLFESYFKRGRVDLPHPQASATKAYTGLALGRAIQLGYLTMEDLDKPVVSFLKDLDHTKFVEGVELITLNHALTMQTGIRISDEDKEKYRNDTLRMRGQREIQTYFEYTEPITPESQTFEYGWGPKLVMQVVAAVVPGSAKDFIKAEVLDKLGITNYKWPTNISGLPQSGSGSSLTARDMLKFGILTYNKGKWNGEQLIPEAFIDKATSRIIGTGDLEIHYGGKDVANQGYGYFWWNADLQVGNKSYYTTSAQGGYGQFITFIEELELLIVHTAHDNDTNYLQLTAERVLPAFVNHGEN